MNQTIEPPTSKQIQQAVEAVKQERPVYTKLLDFYGPLFLAQEASGARVHIEPIHISEDVLSAKAEAQLPLVSLTEFVVDLGEAKSVLGDICDIAISAQSDIGDAAKRLKTRLEEGQIDISILVQSILGDNDVRLEKAATEIGIDAAVLSFILYSSIKPSLSACAAGLSDYMQNQPEWRQGYCPICGSQPILFVLPEEGRRRLVCSFCWHQWEVPRIGCPFCDNQDSNTLKYFTPEGEPAYRVNLCDGCRKYIKGIDAREASHFVYPPLEQISTLHLDIKATEQGYQSGIPMALPE